MQNDQRDVDEIVGSHSPEGVDIGAAVADDAPIPFSKLAVIGLVASLAGPLTSLPLMLTGVPFVWLLLSIAGLVASFVALSSTGEGGRRGRWIAVSGIVVAGLTLLTVFGFVIWVFYSFVTYGT
jgi:hypothetical protein